MPQPLPRRPLARQLDDQPEYAPWEPSPKLRDRAETGLERFLGGIEHGRPHPGDGEPTQ